MFILNGEYVYEESADEKVKLLIGPQRKPREFSRSNIEKIFKWTQFNLTTGEYEFIDIDETMLIDGIEYQPINFEVRLFNEESNQPSSDEIAQETLLETQYQTVLLELIVNK